MKRLGIPVLVLLLLAACSTPHVLPEAPTPIPRLAPATLPVVEPDEPPSAEAGEEAVDEPESSAPETGDAVAGAEVFQASGCGACHSLDGTSTDVDSFRRYQRAIYQFVPYSLRDRFCVTRRQSTFHPAKPADRKVDPLPAYHVQKTNEFCPCRPQK